MVQLDRLEGHTLLLLRLHTADFREKISGAWLLPFVSWCRLKHTVNTDCMPGLVSCYFLTNLVLQAENRN